MSPVTRTNFRPYDRDRSQTGIVVPDLGSFTAYTLTAGRGYVSRFVPSRNMAIVLASIGITTAATANDNFEVAIYNSACTVQLVTTGQVAGKMNATVNTSPTINFASTLNISAGVVYYAVCCCPVFGAAGAALTGKAVSHSSDSILFGSGIGQCESFIYTNGTGVLASDIHAAGLSISSGNPIVALRES